MAEPSVESQLPSLKEKKSLARAPCGQCGDSLQALL